MKKIVLILLISIVFSSGCSSVLSKKELPEPVQYITPGTFEAPEPIELPPPPAFKKSTVPTQRVKIEPFIPEKKSANSSEAIRKAQETSKETATDDRFVNAITEYEFQDGKIYEIYIAKQRITNLLFQEGEEFIIDDIQIGESSGMHKPVLRSSGSGEKKRVNLQFRPKKAGVDTNMVITTNKRVYYLNIRSFKKTYQTAVYWAYPQEEYEKAVAQAYEIQREEKNPGFVIELETANLNYEIVGNASWKPSRVVDNGKQTCIRFPEKTKNRELPPFFLLAQNNETELVNYHYDEKLHAYVVHRLFDTGILKMGKGKENEVYIYNKQSEQQKNAWKTIKRYNHAM